ncbi:hypothetical protein GW17_00014450 [Ensete ventricosum]|nr:hypothetical protein GW17_00014450 [Ensete ventricosum]
MAVSSSVNAAQAIVGLAISSHGSHSADRVAVPAGGFALSSLAGRSLTCSRSPRFQQQRRWPRQASRAASRAAPARAAAVETIEAAATEALVEKSINTIRFLAIDAVEKANSGHPGLPMGCAPMGHILYDEVMRYNPKNPYWFNRDRFVLSAGHGCMLQYALLHLAGYDSVLVRPSIFPDSYSYDTRYGHHLFFPSLHSLSFYDRVSIDAGPLGQGIANAVGLALAERHLAARFNKPDNEIVDHYT